MESKIITYVNMLYTYFVASIFFWLYAAKGVLVYGLVPSACSLFRFFHSEMEKGAANIREELSFGYGLYKGKKFASFLFSFAIVSLYAGLFFVIKSQPPLAPMYVMILLYILALVFLLFTYFCYFTAVKQAGDKEAFLYSYLAVFRKFKASFFILLFLCLSFALAMINLPFFLVAAPSLYVKAVLSLLNKERWFEKGKGASANRGKRTLLNQAVPCFS